MGVTTIREKFKWIDGIQSKIDDINASAFLEKIKEEFGSAYAGFNDSPPPVGSGNPVWKLIDLPSNNSIFCLYYPESPQGFHTIAFYIASTNSNSFSDIKGNEKFKIRFDN